MVSATVYGLGTPLEYTVRSMAGSDARKPRVWVVLRNGVEIGGITKDPDTFQEPQAFIATRFAENVKMRFWPKTIYDRKLAAREFDALQQAMFNRPGGVKEAGAWVAADKLDL